MASTGMNDARLPSSGGQTHGSSTGNAATTAQPTQPTQPTQPRLPADAMGGIFDFMPYGEVRSALLAGRFVAKEVARHVQTLNITTGVQMNVRGQASLRFPNVEDVNVVCLLTKATATRGYRISSDVATRIPYFLLTFPKLCDVFVGGIRRKCYDSNYCDEPSNHKEIFRGLVDACLGALKVGSFPASLRSLKGISDVVQHSRDSCERRVEDPANPCTRCRDLCKYFPIEDAFVHDFDDSLCLPVTETYKILRTREGYQDMIDEDNSSKWVHKIFNCEWFDVPVARNRNKDFCQKMKELGAWLEDSYEDEEDEEAHLIVKYLTNRQRKDFDDLVQAGYDPTAVSRETLYERLLEQHEGNRYYQVWAKSYFDKLLSLGFDVDEEDFIIVDEKNEPALRRLCHELHGRAA